MKTTKFSALLFIALAASLVLTLATRPNRITQDADRQGDAVHPSTGSGFRGKSGLAENELVTPPQPVSLIAAEAVAVKSSTVTEETATLSKGAAATPGEWPLIVYPELARIAELENVPADSALVELRPMLSNSDPVIRLAALESVADMSATGYSSIFAAALADPLAQIRISAIEALADSGDAAVWVYLEPYLFDEVVEVRLAAVEALASLQDTASIPVLAGLLGDGEISIRLQAVNALGEIGGDAAIAYLLQARYDPDRAIRMNAEDILAEANAAGR